ncbi:unnamed protein product [Lota lota]
MDFATLAPNVGPLQTVFGRRKAVQGRNGSSSDNGQPSPNTIPLPNGAVNSSGGRGGSAATATGNRLQLATPASSQRRSPTNSSASPSRQPWVSSPGLRVSRMEGEGGLEWTAKSADTSASQGSSPGLRVSRMEGEGGLGWTAKSADTSASQGSSPGLRVSRMEGEDACELTLDPNTAHRRLSLSEDNRKVTGVGEKQSYPDHPERFDYWEQVLCREPLTGRCYWEVEWEGPVVIGVTYRGITRRGGGDDSRLGGNNKSWSLYCHDREGYTVVYNDSTTTIYSPSPGSNRVGVYLDRPAGTLSFYRVSPDVGGSSDTLTHIHTFQSTFTQEDLLPGFGLGRYGASVSLCRL